MDAGTIKKGTLINAAGLAGKAFLPLTFILIGQLFDARVMGLYYLGFVVMNIVFNLVLSGLKDVVVVYASGIVDDATQEDALYNIFSNTVVLAVVASAVLILLYYLFGRALAGIYYPDPRLMQVLDYMIWTVPLYALPYIVSSAYRAGLQMHWEAVLLGFARPLLICLSVAVVKIVPLQQPVFAAGQFLPPGVVFNEIAANGSAAGLAAGYLGANIFLAFFSVWAFTRRFSIGKLVRSLGSFSWNIPLLRFVVPQNLNTTFHAFVTNLDVLVLGYFQFSPALIGYYGMGAQVVRNIRQIKIAYAGIMGPIISRLHHKRDYKTLQYWMSTVSSWAVGIALPFLFAAGFFRNEILQLFHSSFGGEAHFFLILLIPPFLSCLTGLAGDIVVMTGKVVWNLFNSVTIALLNLVLNLVLIPVWGLAGAALATAISTTIVYFMQLVEVYQFYGIRIVPKILLRPLFFAVVPAVLMSVLHLSGFIPSQGIGKLAFVAGIVLLYALIVVFYRKRHPAPALPKGL